MHYPSFTFFSSFFMFTILIMIELANATFFWIKKYKRKLSQDNTSDSIKSNSYNLYLSEKQKWSVTSPKLASAKSQIAQWLEWGLRSCVPATWWEPKPPFQKDNSRWQGRFRCSPKVMFPIFQGKLSLVDRHHQPMLQKIWELNLLRCKTCLWGRCIGRKWLRTECIRSGPQCASVRRCSLSPAKRGKRRATRIWMRLTMKWVICNCSTIQTLSTSTAISQRLWECLSEWSRESHSTSRRMILIWFFFLPFICLSLLLLLLGFCKALINNVYKLWWVQKW